jgi:hypothetical protein
MGLYGSVPLLLAHRPGAGTTGLFWCAPLARTHALVLARSVQLPGRQAADS